MTSPAEPSDPRPAAAGVLRRILKGTSNYGLGSFLPQLLGFLLIPVYTRLLSPEDYGIADLVTATGAVLVILLRLGLAGAVIRFYFDQKSPEELRSYTSTVVVFLFVWGLAAGALLTFFGRPIFAWITPGVAFYPYLALGVWSAVLSIFPELQRRLLQAREESRRHLWLTTGQFLLGLATTLVLVVGLRLGVLGILLGTFVSTAVYFVVALVYLRGFWSPALRLDQLRASLGYGAPMLPHHLFTWLMTYVNRLILNGLTTTAVVGVFGIASRFASPLTLLFSAINAAWVPVYYAHRGDREGASGKGVAPIVTSLFMVMTWAALGVAVLAPDVLPWIVPAEYLGAGRVLPVLCLAALLRGAYFLVVAEIFFAKSTWFVPLATAVGAALNVGGNLLFVPSLGAVGSAWAMVATNLVVLVLIAAVSHRLLPVRHEWTSLSLAVGLAAGLYAAALLVPDVGPVVRLAAHGGILLGFPAVLIALKRVPVSAMSLWSNQAS